MARRRTGPIVLPYLVSLLAAVALLVVWVVYVLRSVARIRQMAGRVGVSETTTQWVVLGVGCALFFLLIIGITYQLALSLAAQRYARKQDEFLSNITHELKSPLAAIKLHAQTLQGPGPDPTEQQRSLDFILQEADRMAELVDDVLESTRLLSRKQGLAVEPVGLDGFFARYFEAARSRIEGQGVRLAVHVDPGIRVLAVPGALERVLDNLLDNAVRFSQRGGEVRCLVRTAGNRARIEVEDDGIGIPHKELSRIFDRFYQIGKEVGGRRKGTGLGLSIASGLVEEMRGSIRAFSQDGRPGARFVVELPLVGAAT